MLPRLLTLPAALLLTLTGCGDIGATTATDDPASESPSPAGTSSGPTTECTYPEAGAPAREVEPPPTEARAAGRLGATLATGIGDIELVLDAAAAPCTVNSFVSLVEQGYFDDTACHRLTTEGIFVLQCGDPTGTGSGGPGYSFPDEVSGDTTYPAGTLAMANAGPDTNGSQFFIVYEDTRLPPLYTVFGSVADESLEVVQDVARAGTATGGADGPPKTEVLIEEATVGQG